ncbi:TraI/MobA(P) family conjugative relaxase [Desulfobulbus elongatus]|uniref:TraI/MobA(P) family conjugative relaxase n=1 Tax=Desulfobulbus elongatus TaxID=53332 RepID=UPI0006846102|nr:TraI/MobA(P) family conjugative relaxase [Desulfobulbus elongatus]
MISMRIPAGKGKDGHPKKHDFRRLGNYCRDASHEGEKCLLAWHEGCQAPSYDLALIEIEATQAMNTRCKNDKTYHLIVSFRPEDESKLTPGAFREIERAMADALGLSAHQRVCGVHKNTNHLHLHVAYNLIRPDKFTINEPYFDQMKRDAACRAMEEQFGLAVDNGIEERDWQKPQIDQRAAAMEAHAGEQSFQSYALERKAELLQALEGATTWADVHAVFGRYGMEIKPQGNGLAVVRTGGKEGIKASALDRSLTKTRLVTRLGDYEKPAISPVAKEHYDRRPLHPRSAERDALYVDFKGIIDQREQQLKAARQHTLETMQDIKQRAAERRKEQNQRIMSRQTRAQICQALRLQEREALLLAQAAGRDSLKRVREQYPFHDWHGYLKWQADQGNETALAVLRSRPQKTEPEKPQPQTDAAARRAEIKLAGAAKERRIAAMPLGWKHKAALTAINRMEQLAAMEQVGENTSPLFTGVRHDIDNRGVVIFTLPNGGTIRDAGKKLYFSQGQDQAARIYANAKFGKRISVTGNTIERGPNGRPARPNNPIYKQSYLAHIKQICANGLRKVSELNVVRFGKSNKVLLQGDAHPDLER